ncbi:MAG: low molecular weight protein arginine phosphatase [Deltaproteobacteria bacterium]
MIQRFAEVLLRMKLEALGVEDISVMSAGLFAYPGNSADRVMVGYLSQMGIPSPNDHQARQLTEEEVDWADLILVMEKAHAKLIEELWPRVQDKVELLGKHASPEQRPDDIIDPYGNSPYHYRLAQAQITMAENSLAKKLALKKDHA